MIRLRPLPCIGGLILVGEAGGIAVNAAPRMKAIEKPAADPCPPRAGDERDGGRHRASRLHRMAGRD
jgi:hypothetical protein